MGELRIRNVRVILTAPEGIDLIVVKVETTEPGLYGLGCATFTQRALAVKTVVEEYLRPFLVGKDPNRIEDIWQSAYVSGYWRNGPVLNNALSGVDEALWDIKGKLAAMPVYELLGGRCREGVPVYRHADGRDPAEVEEHVRAFMEQGYRYIRCQMGGYGSSQMIDDQLRISPAAGAVHHRPEGALPGAYFDPDAYARGTVRMIEHVRSRIGVDVELLHDVHERLVPVEAVRLAKALEPFRLFFLEDPFAPEQVGWFETLRRHAAVPVAMGELFTHPVEWETLVKDRLIDFIRCHVSNIGGLTPARKLATFCEAFGVRTAWHGPGDVSPVGHAANLHLGISSHNLGIQEWPGFSDRLREVFPGAPEVRGGYAYLNDRPGLGVDIDEEKAARYPCLHRLPDWTLARLPDGTPARP